MGATAMLIGLLVGCQPRSASPDQPATTTLPPPAGPSASIETPDPGRPAPPSPANPAPDGATPRSPAGDSTSKKAPTPPPLPKNVFRIPGAGTEGWVKSDRSATDLGERLDRASRNLKGAFGDVTFWVRNQQIQGNNTATVRVVDATDYEIEYQLPSNPVVTEILVAGKGQRMRLAAKGGWKPVKTVVPARSQVLARWETEFPAMMFANLGGEAVWAPVLEDLLAGKNGFRSVLEEKTMTVNGRAVPFYRVLAERPGPNAARLEMRFDGARFVPLTIKLNRTPVGKKPELVQWNARWAFGQPLPKRQYTD